ncbi:MAG: hypothetical protein SFU56_13500 [Capsulimonadales bacterium]|nr:hypothetical protein [Capsulimonadales bacterium]
MNTPISRLAAFAERLRPDAARLDTEDGLVREWFDAFRNEGFHELGGSRAPLSGEEFAEVLATLGAVSGAFAFVALQQIVANMHLAVPEEPSWPVVGVAFGHLRNVAGPAPVWDGATVSGFVPWLTGANLFPEVILGMRTLDGDEVFARVDARDRPAFRHSEPMPLIACAGTRTVTVRVDGLSVSPSQVLRSQPNGTMAEGDAQSVLYQTPLMVGCARACLSLIAASGRLGDEEKSRYRKTVKARLESVREAFSGSDALQGRRLRARLGDLTVRLARLAVMASGGSALITGHPAERLYREALLYSLMAQTPEIVQDAFAEALR